MLHVFMAQQFFAHATVCSTDVYDQAADHAGPVCPFGRLPGQSVIQTMKILRFLTQELALAAAQAN